MPAEPSLTRIAFYLRTLDLDMSPLHKLLKKRAKRRNGPKLPPDALPGDAFELWKLHFESFGPPEMVQRIKSLEAAFIEHVTKGMPGLRIRVLDHGVCSGLLQLKISTFFYRLFASVEDKALSKSSKAPVARAAKKLLSRETELEYPYDYEYWWSGVVWATASAALHNMQQREGAWCDGHEPGPLSLNEDPLTYLGVLVDCLQDWDRYFVFDSPTRAPVQGVDIKLGCQNGKVVVALPEGLEKQADKLRKDLDCSLVDWKSLVELLPPPLPKTDCQRAAGS